MKKVIHSKPELVRDQDEKKKLGQGRTDGWQNMVTLLGTSADKRTAARIHWEPHDPEFFEQLYSGGGIPARIVDLVPEHALRNWITFEGDTEGGDSDGEIEEAMEDRCQELNLRTVFANAWKWGRGYGGGLIYIVTDTSDPSTPLRFGEKVLALQDLTRRDVRIMTTDVEFDMGSPNYGKPRIYYLNVQMGSQFKGYPVHWTRVVRMDGQLVPRITYIRNNYWHDSILNRVYNAIRNYEQANDSVAACLLDFNVDVFKMKNLANMIAAGNEQLVTNRIETMSYVKSVLNAMLIDSDNEEYENKSRSLEGVAELLRVQADRLVADTDIPHTILLGESPDGSSATGNSTNQQWYNFIGTEQKNYAKPKLRRLFEVIFGRTVKFKFNSLREMDDAEKADLHLKQAQADQIYLEKNVLDASEVAKSRFGGEEYSIETTLDMEARDAGMMPGGGEDLGEDDEGCGVGEDDGKGADGDDDGDDDGDNEPPDKTGGKQPPAKKNDDVFHIAGDQPPEGKSTIGARPSEPEPLGEYQSEESSKDLEGFAQSEAAPGQASDQVEGQGVQGLFADINNPGTQFDLRNERGETAGTVPKVQSFIGQTESLPFRDPRTDPHMKGPGVPNNVRTVLPTRGTGVIAKSGYDFDKDPKLAASSREQIGQEGHSIEETIRADAYSEEKNKNRERAATIIVRDGDKFLMGPTVKDKRWTMPGGKIEDNESAHQGALRELAEETGIQAGRLKFLGSRLVEPEKGRNVEVHMYEHHLKDGVKPTHKKDPDKEVSGWKWFDSDKPLSQDVLGNLKHANNVALNHMGLLK